MKAKTVKSPLSQQFEIHETRQRPTTATTFFISDSEDTLMSTGAVHSSDKDTQETNIIQ